MSRFAKRVDANQSEIVAVLRAHGVRVLDVSWAGRGLPDLLCHYRGRTRGLEVKDGRKVPSQRRLTPAEVAFAEAFPDFVATVECAEDALAVLGVRPSP